MANPDLQFQFQLWLSGKRQEADDIGITKPRGQLAEFYRGRSEAFAECFAKLIEFIELAKDADNG